jgi:hypothetical protein
MRAIVKRSEASENPFAVPSGHRIDLRDTLRLKRLVVPVAGLAARVGPSGSACSSPSRTRRRSGRGRRLRTTRRLQALGTNAAAWPVPGMPIDNRSGRERPACVDPGVCGCACTRPRMCTGSPPAVPSVSTARGSQQGPAPRTAAGGCGHGRGTARSRANPSTCSDHPQHHALPVPRIIKHRAQFGQRSVN